MYIIYIYVHKYIVKVGSHSKNDQILLNFIHGCFDAIFNQYMDFGH